MPIAAKLFYFQRRHPATPPVEPTDDSLRRSYHADRRQVHPLRSARHSPGHELARGSQRDSGASSKSITEPTRSMLYSSVLSNNASNDRLPDAVQQAKERLHQRLRSADFFLGRRQTAPATGTFWAGPNPPSVSDVFTSKDCRLDGPVMCFNCSASSSTHKVKQITAAPCIDSAGVGPCSKPVSKLGQETLQGTIDGDDVESSVDCSICLEGCHSGAEGLVQLQCKHIFHSACLEQWLQSRADCPYCRASVILPKKQ